MAGVYQRPSVAREKQSLEKNQKQIKRTPDLILLKAGGLKKETRTTAEKPQIRGAQWYNQAEAVLRGGGGGNREGAGAYSLFFPQHRGRTETHASHCNT